MNDLLSFLVMPGLVPGIHVFAGNAWMAGSSPAMTMKLIGAR